MPRCSRSIPATWPDRRRWRTRILAQNPGHLFGYVIRGTVARWQKDDKALARAYAGFLEHYDAELKANRPEYADHKPSIDEFHQQARHAKTGAAGT